MEKLQRPINLLPANPGPFSPLLLKPAWLGNISWKVKPGTDYSKEIERPRCFLGFYFSEVKLLSDWSRQIALQHQALVRNKNGMAGTDCRHLQWGNRWLQWRLCDYIGHRWLWWRANDYNRVKWLYGRGNDYTLGRNSLYWRGNDPVEITWLHWDDYIRDDHTDCLQWVKDD